MAHKTYQTTEQIRWVTVTIFAVAMAWVEAAVVFYLRTMIGRIDPYQTNPLPEVANLGATELAREAATLIMLLMVGMLAGRTSRTRLGYSAIAFGFWDIFYYVFLKVMSGWPHSLSDWDILFLLPLPWWGPVLAPILISVLMITWGTLVNMEEAQPSQWSREKVAWCLSLAGMGIALYVFMADSVHALHDGADAVRRILPVSFNCRLFGFGFVLMTAPILHLLWNRQRGRLQLSPQFAKIEPS